MRKKTGQPTTKEMKPSKGDREPFSTYVDGDLLGRVRQLALLVSVERGVRVSIADITNEAFVDILAKYKK